jgi:transcription antitermination protein NusB
MSRAAKRRASRLAAVQALYQMDVAGKGAIEAVGEFETFWIGKEVDGIELPEADHGFFRDLVSGVVENQITVDRTIDRLLTEGWPLKRIELVLRAALRAGAYELMHRKDVPPRVAISEYVTVIRAFYDGDEPGIANAVLDKLAREIRAEEMATERNVPEA